MKSWLQSCAGVANIIELSKLVPVGVWDPIIRKSNMLNYLGYINQHRAWIASGMNISEGEILNIIELAYDELNSTEYKSQSYIARVFGQKIEL